VEIERSFLGAGAVFVRGKILWIFVGFGEMGFLRKKVKI
jgi:hypothetical protein